MAVTYIPESGLITIETADTTYQMLVDAHRYLLHLYYGRKIQGDARSLLDYRDRGFSANPEDAGTDRTYSLEFLPQEYPFAGSADFRTPAFRCRNEDGSFGCDLRVVDVQVRRGKYDLPGLPSSYGDTQDRQPAGPLPEASPAEENVQTLDILLRDPASGLGLHLLYGVFERENVVTRAVRAVNGGSRVLWIEKIASCALDFLWGDYETLTFYGRHAYERNVQRTAIGHGRYSVGSRRGASSHFYNPFVVFMEPGCTEDAGIAYGIHFVYSGNFLFEAEKSGYDQTRVVMGLSEEEFSWQLAPGEMFDAPEVVLTCSDQGLGKLSNLLHRFIRSHIERGAWKERRRPVLINNWEATYMDYDREKLLKLARKASDLGIELFVLDDGWFGERSSDNAGLGDWRVNTKKLGGSLADFSGQIHSLGMLFGLWLEPEMVNEDSDLYRAHPDWVLRIPGRSFSRGRNQLVLDLSRREIAEYLFAQLCGVLDNAGVDYIKWDMNRNITDAYSAALPASRQGEVMHRYMLGVYQLLGRVCKRYPHILVETCSGGGGRYDLGMMCYSPQIWCSDNTDAVDRCAIQYGTSFGFPPSSMGAHVSAVPNEQTGRRTPFATRAAVAMTGTFGYELDLSRLPAEECAAIPEQIRVFQEDYDVTHWGDWYRLCDPIGALGNHSCAGMPDSRAGDLSAWMCVASDRREAVVTAVSLTAHGNPNTRFLRLKGLDEKGTYRCREDGRDYPGSLLMSAGLRLPALGEYEACRMHFVKLCSLIRQGGLS